MAAKIFEKHGGKMALVAAGAIGALIGEHTVFSGDSYSDRLAGRTDSYMAGQKFNAEGLLVEKLSKPNRATVDAVLRHSLDNLEQDAPNDPDPEARAIALCGAVAASGFIVDGARQAAWAGMRNPDSSGDTETATIAANKCNDVINAAITGHENLVIPVNNEQ